MALAAGAALGGSPMSVRAIGAAEPPPSPNRLDHPIVDLAVLEPSGPDGAPRLLTVEQSATDTSSIRLRILERDRTWELVDEHVVDFGDSAFRDQGFDGAGVPWLVGLSPASFVMITSDESGDAAIVGLRTDAGPGGNQIGETGAQLVNGPLDAAAAADVDGDGTSELVLASQRSGRLPDCPGTGIEVLDAGFRSLRTFAIPGRLVASGVVGAFDDLPGDDLFAYAWPSPSCPADPDGSFDMRSTAVRLGDGSLLLDRSSPQALEVPIGNPLRVDIDADGRDEVLTQDDGALAMIDPGDAWHGTPVADRAVPLLAVGADAPRGRGSRLAWLAMDWLGAPTGSVGTATAVRKAGHIAVEGLEKLALDRTEERESIAAATLIDGANMWLPSAGWYGDLDGSGCPVLIIPLAIRPCGDTATLRSGAAWVATRPLLATGEGTRRRLLVAGGLEWGTDAPPSVPAPWAAAPAGWWRHGPSGSFVLSELRAADVTYFRDFPVPRATVERVAAPDRTTNVPGFTGSRLFVVTEPLPEGAAEPRPIGSSLGMFVIQPGGNVRRSVARVEVPPGLESGRDGGVAGIRLGDATLRDGTAIDRWMVTVVPINDWGEVGPATTGTVERDLVGPSLALDVPMVTPVWPLPAKLTGASDPDTTVVVDGIGEVKLDRRGRFDVVTQLAPWPQTLRLSAIDESGNVTRREVSVVGGVDYRRFPWAIIAAVALLVLVALSGVLGSRRIRPPTPADGPPRRRWVWPTVGLEATPARADADDGPVIEIEELPPGSGLPRT